VAGSCGHGNEPSVAIKGGELLNKLSDCQILKKDSAPWSSFPRRCGHDATDTWSCNVTLQSVRR